MKTRLALIVVAVATVMSSSIEPIPVLGHLPAASADITTTAPGPAYLAACDGRTVNYNRQEDVWSMAGGTTPSLKSKNISEVNGDSTAWSGYYSRSATLGTSGVVPFECAFNTNAASPTEDLCYFKTAALQADQGFYHGWLDNSGNWHEEFVGGIPSGTSAGVGCAWFGTSDLYYATLRSNGTVMYYIKDHNGTWDSSWSSIALPTVAGVAVYGDVTLCSAGTSRLDAFVANNGGTGSQYDGSIWHAKYDGSNWTSWESLGTSSSSSAVAPLGQIYCDAGEPNTSSIKFDFAETGADGNVYHKWYDGTYWQPGNSTTADGSFEKLDVSSDTNGVLATAVASTRTQVANEWDYYTNQLTFGDTTGGLSGNLLHHQWKKHNADTVHCYEGDQGDWVYLGTRQHNYPNECHMPPSGDNPILYTTGGYHGTSTSPHFTYLSTDSPNLFEVVTLLVPNDGETITNPSTDNGWTCRQGTYSDVYQFKDDICWHPGQQTDDSATASWTLSKSENWALEVQWFKNFKRVGTDPDSPVDQVGCPTACVDNLGEYWTTSTTGTKVQVNPVSITPSQKYTTPVWPWVAAWNYAITDFAASYYDMANQGGMGLTGIGQANVSDAYNYNSFDNQSPGPNPTCNSNGGNYPCYAKMYSPSGLSVDWDVWTLAIDPA